MQIFKIYLKCKIFMKNYCIYGDRKINVKNLIIYVFRFSQQPYRFDRLVNTFKRVRVTISKNLNDFVCSEFQLGAEFFVLKTTYYYNIFSFYEK